jgi:hypothetical protein
MFAINDPAGTAIQFSKAVNKYSQHSARLMTLETRYSHSWEKDIHVPELGPDGIEEIAILMREADIFHFHMTCDEHQAFGPHLPADFMKGKAIIHHHHGHHDFRSNPQSFRDKYKKLGRSNLLVSTPDLMKKLPEARWQPNLVPINSTLLMPIWGRFDHHSALKVCHSPTRKDLKNTNEFLEAVARLKKKGVRLDVDLIDDVPNSDCLARKRRCHVLFDHMQGYYGVSSLEGLSQGVAVITGLDDWNRAHVAEFAQTDELPWITAHDLADLEHVLTELNQNRERCQRLGLKGREFMEKHWSDKHVAGHLVEFYETI